MSLALLAALGAVVVGFVLHPIFTREQVARYIPDEAGRERGQIEDQKNRLLTSIKDLDFEYRAGKLTDVDYQRVRADDLSQLAKVMTRLEAMGADQKPSPPETEPPGIKTPEPTEPSETSEESSDDVACLSCQKINPPDAKFCFSCGKPIEIPLQCPRCGTKLLEEARFCTSCGTTATTND
jgi:RNA polymerase subunit RPABC4/transcription elongation factor Spt4